jgi:uncharacterized phage protein gp47/JayE
MAITAQGFTRPTLAQIQSEMLTLFEEAFKQIDPVSNIEYKPSLEPEDFLGALALILADQFDKQYQDAEDTYYSLFLPTAFGVALDRAALPAVRKNATQGKTTCLFSGVPGTVTPVGTLFENEGKVRYGLLSDVTIDTSGDTLGEVRALIPGTAGNTPAGSITFIPRPINGLNTVTNILPVTNATDIETDATFRARAIAQLSAGSSSALPSVIASVQGVNGVVDVFGAENLEPYPVNGVPPGGVSITVEGGEDEEIAQAIYKQVAAGQPTAGSVTVIILDRNNNAVPVRFSRIIQVAVFVDVVKVTNAAYDSVLSDDVIRIIAGEFVKGARTGERIYAWKAKASLFETTNPDLLPGLVDATVTIGLASVSGGALPLTEIPMAISERGVTDFAQIVVR